MDDLLYQINCLSVLQLALASVAYYLSFIPIFFALIGALVVDYFGRRWLFKANERGNGKMIIPPGLSYLVFTVIGYLINIRRNNTLNILENFVVILNSNYQIRKPWKQALN